MNQKLVQKIEYLNDIVRSGKYPRGISFLGAGSGNFYQCVYQSAWALKKMKQRNQKNRKNWDLHIQRIDVLIKIAKDGK